MKCQNCDREFDIAAGDCPYCGAVPEVDATRMSSGERDSFEGITVGSGQDESNYRQQTDSGRPKVYFKKVSFSSGILSTIVLLALIALFIFVAMPIFFVIALVLAVGWILSGLF